MIAIFRTLFVSAVIIISSAIDPTGVPTGLPTYVGGGTWTCDEGYFCTDQFTVASCPAGFVCPANTFVDPTTIIPTPPEYLCPSRTFLFL
jgi:hypothetical protein